MTVHAFLHGPRHEDSGAPDAGCDGRLSHEPTSSRGWPAGRYSCPFGAHLVCQIAKTVGRKKQFSCTGIENLRQFRAVLTELDSFSTRLLSGPTNRCVGIFKTDRFLDDYAGK